MGLKGIGLLPDDWREALGWAPENEILQDLEQRVATARAEGDVFPAIDEVFAALQLTPLASVRAVIIGQDPYHGLGEAHGLAFSVRDTFQPLPPSLRNIRRELKADLGIDAPPSGSLEAWARNGVLLLNAVLTVRRDKAGSHRSFGWERVTSAVLQLVARQEAPVAFLLWGGFAKKLASGVDDSRHVVVRSTHPSPFSQKGFLGSRPFSRANDGLIARGRGPVDWRL